MFWNSIKHGQSKDIYNDLLSGNEILRTNYNERIDKKTNKHIFQEDDKNDKPVIMIIKKKSTNIKLKNNTIGDKKISKPKEKKVVKLTTVKKNHHIA